MFLVRCCSSFSRLLMLVLPYLLHLSVVCIIILNISNLITDFAIKYQLKFSNYIFIILSMFVYVMYFRSLNTVVCFTFRYSEITFPSESRICCATCAPSTVVSLWYEKSALLLPWVSLNIWFVYRWAKALEKKTWTDDLKYSTWHTITNIRLKYGD